MDSSEFVDSNLLNTSEKNPDQYDNHALLSKPEPVGEFPQPKNKKKHLYNVREIFNKEVRIDNTDFYLPPVETLFTENPWKVEDLLKIKEELNRVKSLLNDKPIRKWRLHTKWKHFSSTLTKKLDLKKIRLEFYTQAWAKFYDLVSTYPLVPGEIPTNQLKSVHLCEGPGAFVASLNHWLKINRPTIDWNWTASTLNPYYEGNSSYWMLNDDRLILHTQDHWYFGVDGTGDMMKEVNLNGLIEREKNGKIGLITADGSVDCVDVPDEQEMVVSQLHYCETITALHLLEQNGNFVIKVFTVLEYKTICLIYLLTCCFNQIIIKKPVCSKGGNSEVYVVCLGYKGRTIIEPYLGVLVKHYEKGANLAMFRKSDIPDAFINQIINMGKFFQRHQTEVIKENIRSFGELEESYHEENLRRLVVLEFIKRFRLYNLPDENMAIVDVQKMRKSRKREMNSVASSNSYNMRKAMDNMGPKKKLWEICTNFLKINEPSKGIMKFKDEFENLQITVGIPYDEIRTSKFCQYHLLRICKTVMDIKDQLKLKFQFPNTEDILFFARNCEQHYLPFIFGLTINNLDTITKLHEKVKELKDGDNFSLLGFPLLTQFNVGLLYIIGHAFDNFEIIYYEKIGYEIKFVNYLAGKNIVKYLEEIRKISENVDKEGNVVLSVVPTLKLYENNLFYDAVVLANHVYIKHFCNKVHSASFKI